jgi:hypothetical protein
MLRAAARTGLLVLLTSGGLACGCDPRGDDDDTDNSDPAISIEGPVADAVVSEAHEVELWARITDPDEPNTNLEYLWTSDVVGELFGGRRTVTNETGNETLLWVNPPPGDHVLTVRAWDTSDGEAEASVTIKVTQNTAPMCEIRSPVPAERLTLSADGFLLAEGDAGDMETDVVGLDIRWEDEDGNLLAEGNPNEDGLFAMGMQAVSGAMTLILRVTDPLGLECTASVSFTTNFRPTSPEVSLAPDPPFYGDDLVGTMTVGSTDPDGLDELISYRWEWEQNGSPVITETNTIDGSEMLRDDVWTVSVYAVDVEGADSEPATASVVVGNTPPTAPVVGIVPNPASQALDLQCVILEEGVDPDPEDDDLGYEFTWIFDNSIQPWEINFTPWTETNIGDTWKCQANSTDGESVSDLSAIASVEVVEGCSAGFFPGGGAVTVPDALPLRLGTGSFTVEAWVKLSGYGAGASPTVIVSKNSTAIGDGWILGVCGTLEGCAGAPAWKLWGDGSPSITGGEPMSLNQWHHVALVHEASNQWASLYLDGILAGDGNMPQPNGATNAALVIGDDGLPTSVSNHIGIIDDVRITNTDRYTTDFTPARTLYSDTLTSAIWGFEEGATTDVHDLSQNGHDGIATGMGWTTDSSCIIDRAPTQPVLAITPSEPPTGVELTCSVAVPAVDPEGLAVTYPGEWFKNGSTWSTFSDLPSTVPAGDNTGTDEWICVASGFDGALLSEEAIVTAWSGFTNICTLTVPDPSQAQTLECPFFVPVDGQLRLTMDNPDGSTDGVFNLDTGLGTELSVFTGTKDFALGGTTVVAYLTHDAEINVSGGMWNLEITYDPSAGTANSGTDTLTMDYVPGPWLESFGNGYIGTATVGQTNTTPVYLGTATIPVGGRLMFEALQCGTGGGIQGIYADADGVVGNDAVSAVPTGNPNQCTSTNGVYSQSIDPGTYDFTVELEDLIFLNNGGTRSVDVYWYVP